MSDTRNEIPFDDSRASAEGWGLFTRPGRDTYGKIGHEICRDDDSATFTDDFQAMAFVLNSAMDGSDYHRDALSLHLGCELRLGAD